MAVLLNAFQEAVGSVKFWLRAAASEPLPANWAILDGSTIVDPDSPFNGKALPDMRDGFLKGHPTLTNANFGADVAYYAGGTIPSGGVASHNVQHSHAAGAHTHNIGSHNHSIAASGSHNHYVNSHQHTVNSHTHSISSDGLHAHTVGDPVTITGAPGFANPGGPGGHSHNVSNNGSHSHGGGTGSSNPQTNFAGQGNTNDGGDHSHGGTTGSATGTTDPGAGNTADALATPLDNEPPYLGMLAIIRIK